VLARPGWADFVFAFHDGRGDRTADAGPNCSPDGFAPGGPLRRANRRGALDAGRKYCFHFERHRPGTRACLPTKDSAKRQRSTIPPDKSVYILARALILPWP
jgi:hypothetical protein